MCRNTKHVEYRSIKRRVAENSYMHSVCTVCTLTLFSLMLTHLFSYFLSPFIYIMSFECREFRNYSLPLTQESI